MLFVFLLKEGDDFCSPFCVYVILTETINVMICPLFKINVPRTIGYDFEYMYTNCIFCMLKCKKAQGCVNI